MKTVKNGFAELLVAYAASVVIPNASESAVAELERPCNNAARVQTGCVKSSPIEGLRNLVGMPSMKEIATVQATRLHKKSIWSTKSSSTPLKVAMEDQTSVRIRKGKSTLKEEAELRLALVVLLQLPRAPLPLNLGYKF